jgi:hypothetical protein
LNLPNKSDFYIFLNLLEFLWILEGHYATGLEAAHCLSVQRAEACTAQPWPLHRGAVMARWVVQPVQWRRSAATAYGGGSSADRLPHSTEGTGAHLFGARRGYSWRQKGDLTGGRATSNVWCSSSSWAPILVTISQEEGVGVDGAAGWRRTGRRDSSHWQIEVAAVTFHP